MTFPASQPPGRSSPQKKQRDFTSDFRNYGVQQAQCSLKRSAPTGRQAAPIAQRSSNEVLLPAKVSGISHLILKNMVFKKRSALFNCQNSSHFPPIFVSFAGNQAGPPKKIE